MVQHMSDQPSVDSFLVLKRLDSEAQARVSLEQFTEAYAKAEFTKDSVEFKSIDCPVDPYHSRVRMQICDNPKATLTPGIRGDVVWSIYGDLIIGPRVLDVLRRAAVSGYATRPIHVAGDTMYLLTARGWAGMASPESKIYQAHYHECCGHVRYKVRGWPSRIVNPATWDGSDIFMVWPLPSQLFVTRRVADVLSEAGVTGLACLPELSVIRRSDTFAPGRLSYYMDSEVARERGRSAGIREV